MKKKYTRKQILESIKYWEKQLYTGNYRKFNESQLNESKIGDFFGRLFRTKKFLAKQAELERAAAEAEFEKQHPLVTVAKKLNALNTEFSFRFTNVTMEHYRYNNEYKADCIVVRRTHIDASDGYDDMKGSRDYVLKLVKQCGFQDKCHFYEVNQYMAVVMPEPDVNWGPDLEPFMKVTESKIGDFFGKLFKTKKFNADFEKKHPLAAVAKKLNELDDEFDFVFTNTDMEHMRYNADSKADCIVVRRKHIDASDRYDDMKGSRDYVLKLVKKCGFQKECRFYEINQHTAVIMQQPEANWSPNLQSLKKEWSPNFQSSEEVNESKISDFFGKLFQTKKFLAKQAELEKAAQEKADAEFAKKHPLAEVAQKMDKASSDYVCRFTNADIENDGYPWDMTDKMDCIAVRYWSADPLTPDRGTNIKDDKDDIMQLFKQCGGPDNCEFYAIKSFMAVIIPKHSGWSIKDVHEGEEQ